MRIAFWGVRGSFPVSEPHCRRYGGNTPCVGFETASTTILFDAGTGIRAAGKDLVDRGISEVHLLISHPHWDHIQGFPHFAPLYQEGARIVVYGPGSIDYPLREIFQGQQDAAFFPVALNDVKARLEFVELVESGSLVIGDVQVLCRRLNHPGIAVGFRLEVENRAVTYICDADIDGEKLLAVDLLPPSNVAGPASEQRCLRQLRDAVCDLAHSAELLVCDTFFLTEEYRPDFGHSRPEDAIALGRRAGSRRVALFHHAPHRRDDELDALLERCKREAPDGPEVLVAAEGLKLEL